MATTAFDDEPMPLDLYIVAGLFTCAGITAALHIASGFFTSQLHLDTGIIGIWIGAGLRRRDSRACTWASLMTAFAFAVGIVALGLAFLGADGVFTCGRVVEWHLPKPLAVMLTLSVLTFTSWRWYVLERDEVRALFGHERDPSQRGRGWNSRLHVARTTGATYGCPGGVAPSAAPGACAAALRLPPAESLNPAPECPRWRP